MALRAISSSSTQDSNAFLRTRNEARARLTIRFKISKDGRDFEKKGTMCRLGFSVLLLLSCTPHVLSSEDAGAPRRTWNTLKSFEHDHDRDFPEQNVDVGVSSAIEDPQSTEDLANRSLPEDP